MSRYLSQETRWGFSWRSRGADSREGGDGGRRRGRRWQGSPWVLVAGSRATRRTHSQGHKCGFAHQLSSWWKIPGGQTEEKKGTEAGGRLQDLSWERERPSPQPCPLSAGPSKSLTEGSVCNSTLARLKKPPPQGWGRGSAAICHTLHSLKRLLSSIKEINMGCSSPQRPPWRCSGEEPTCHCRRRGLGLWAGRSPGEGNDNPLQDSCLGNLMDRGAWRATVYGVAKSQTGLETKQQQQTFPKILSPC